LQKREGLGFQSSNEEMVSEKVEDLVMNEVKRTFNPEFLNVNSDAERGIRNRTLLRCHWHSTQSGNM
jgi:hypothetical protein